MESRGNRGQCIRNWCGHVDAGGIELVCFDDEGWWRFGCLRRTCYRLKGSVVVHALYEATDGLGEVAWSIHRSSKFVISHAR